MILHKPRLCFDITSNFIRFGIILPISQAKAVNYEVHINNSNTHNECICKALLWEKRLRI